MKKHKRGFQRKLLTTSIASCLLAAGLPSMVSAADDEITEIAITGLRGSLRSSMNTKRDSFGVVDSITSEDIGKFPDTNLAESLQRIPGVSISRVNGEGSRITVRGFGDDNNMVTLNGRMMPAADVYGGGSGAGGTYGAATRAFNFANLASESVRAIEVSKTGKASMATGGIGATVDILTARPLNSSNVASIGAKAVYDTTNRTGDDITPEVSGIFSYADDTNTFGVSLSFSHQERDSGTSSIAENNWNIGTWGEDTLYSFAPGAIIENQPADGQLYARPNDIRYAFSDRQRTRDNAQLVFQWAPTDAITATADYTFAENELLERRGESTSWLANGNSITQVVFDTNPVIASPLFIAEVNGPRDQGFAQQIRQQVNTLESLGFNLEWDVNDSLSLSFDIHDSSMKSKPNGPGNSGEIESTFGAPSQMSHTIDFSGDLPIYTMVLEDCEDAGGRGNCNGVLDAGDVGSQVVRVFYAAQETEIQQFKFDGSFDLDNGVFDFGIESRAMEMNNQSSNRYMGMGDWGIANVGDIPLDLLEEFNLSSFDSFDASASFQGGLKGNAEDIGQALVDRYGTAENGYVLEYNPDFSQNNIIEEDTLAAYFQIGMNGNLGGMETNILMGMRYETTDVKSTSLMLIPQHLLWQDNNDFQTIYATEETPFSVTADYDHFLPSIDFDIMLTDNVKARISYSKTIARAGYSNLQADVSNFSSGGGSTTNGAIPTATSANPELLPLESNNFDISFEWYYADSSYASVGVFGKRVNNFIGTEKVDKTLFGILDQTGGPRTDAAVAALADGGWALDDTSLFVMTAIMDNPADYPGGASEFDGTLAQSQAVATAYDIVPNADDPETIWRVAQPVNNKEAEVYGAEFALQHFFGDSGFGLQANYTIVDGDVGYDDGADPSESQFALLGLSDTANLVGLYENGNWAARLAYNWRDEYLRSASQGSSRNPIYVEEYYQFDLKVSYMFNDHFSVFFEGLNVTGEDRRDHGRSIHQIEYMEDLGARYQVGGYYNF